MPDPECANIWAALLKNKPYGDKKIRGYIFKVNETKTAIVPDVEIIRTESREDDWGVFENHIQNMPKDICFGAYDYEYEDHSSGYNDGDSVVTKNKLCMLVWAPDTAKPQRKMLAPSSSKSLEAVFNGSTKTVQMNSPDEATFAAVGGVLGCL